MKIDVSVKGSSVTDDFLHSIQNGSIFENLAHLGEEGVRALSQATPRDSGATAESWIYDVVKDKNSWSIIWSNTHMAGPTPVAVLLQMGHGTRNGGLVYGYDYINPALKPVFDQILDKAWKAVTSR